MAKTPIRGYTIPDLVGGDSLDNWLDLAVQGLTDVENAQFVSSGSLTASDTPDKWPLGMAQMGLTQAQASDGGWPGAGSGMLITIRRTDGSYTYHLYMQADTPKGPKMWVRNGNVVGWSPWVAVASPNLPSAMASGQVTGSPPSSGGTIAMPVVFPKNVFTTTPRITLGAQSSLPGQLNYTYGNASATGCTIYLYRQNDTDTSVSWVAVQGVDG